MWVWVVKQTYDETELLVVSGVHGLALFNTAAVVGFALDIKGNPAQLKDDISLSLCERDGEREMNYLTDWRDCLHIKGRDAPGPEGPSSSSCGPPTG